MNSQAHLDKVKDLYRLNFGMFPMHLESVAREYCESLASPPMAYVRLVAEQEFRGVFAYVARQPRFAHLNQDDCELIERLFRAGTTPTALTDALDERRSSRDRDEAPESLPA